MLGIREFAGPVRRGTTSDRPAERSTGPGWPCERSTEPTTCRIRKSFPPEIRRFGSAPPLIACGMCLAVPGRHLRRSRSPPVAAPPPHVPQPGPAMLIIDGRSFAHPTDQGRLGKDVEERLHVLADLVEQMQDCEAEDRHPRPLDVATCTIRQLSYLAHRKREIGPLCTAVDKEFMMAQSIIVDMNSIARSWCSGEETHAVPEVDEGWATVIPRMPRIEYRPYVMLLARFIRQRFPGATDERWEQMARMALQAKSGKSRRNLSRPPDPGDSRPAD